MPPFFNNHRNSLRLIASLAVGSIIGLILGPKAVILKPLSDIFLNLLFTIVIPMVFFSLATAMSSITNTVRLRSILMAMLGVFIVTGVIASAVMVVGVTVFNPASPVPLTSLAPVGLAGGSVSIADKLVHTFTVSDFGELLSRKNMMALIVIALLVGFSTSAAGDSGIPFRQFLASANEVMMRVVKAVMVVAPIGLGASFAYLTGVFGPELLKTYGRAMALYYPVALIYFGVGFSIYAVMVSGWSGMRRFWKCVIPVSLTAFGTGSSIATIPINLEASKEIGVPQDIRQLVIPLGSTIHMDGSCLSAILKIAVLFGVFGGHLHGVVPITIAIGVALISGTVMSGIPGGGFLGELMIVTLYGFPPEALPIAAMIGILVDPIATMVNSVGDTMAGMMVARVLGGKDWMAGHG